MSNEDWSLLGFNSNLYRPEDLIINTFPIPPVAIRPSIRADFLASATYEDDLTHKLADIIKTNEKLRKQKEKELVSGEQSKYGTDLQNFLQYHISTYFENDKEVFKLIVSGNEEETQKVIAQFKDEFKRLSPEEISFPRSCNISGYKWRTVIIKGKKEKEVVRKKDKKKDSE